MKHVSPRDRAGLRHGIPLVSLDERLAAPPTLTIPHPGRGAGSWASPSSPPRPASPGADSDVKTAALREKAKQLRSVSSTAPSVSDLQPAEARTREENQYRQHSDKDDQFCLGCLNFVPAAVETACGTLQDRPRPDQPQTAGASSGRRRRAERFSYAATTITPAQHQPDRIQGSARTSPRR